MNVVSNKQKKILFEKVNSLSKTEHEEIYKILCNHNTDSESKIMFSKNRNGIFFSLSEVEDSLYSKLDKFVDFCLMNKKSLDAYDKKINECKINNNFTNILSDSENINREDEAIEKYNEDWNMIITEPKSVQRVSNYIERIMNDRDNVCKKKMNIKFNNAKKKFSKKTFSERKIEGDEEFLTEEKYIL